MQCWKARRWLSPYLDGELDESRKTDLEAHLARCGNCRAELARLRGQWAGLAHAKPAPQVPPDLWNQVSRALDEWERLPWYRRREAHLLRAACVSVCVAVGFACGALLSWGGAATNDVSPADAVPERMVVAEAFDVRSFGFGEEMEGLFRCVPK